MINAINLTLPITTESRRSFSTANSPRDPNTSFSKKRIGDYAYYLTDFIGSGFSSQVYKCHHRDNSKELFAVKVIKLSKINKQNLNFLKNQIDILQELNHPNIIKFHNVYYTQNNCYIVTDYCQGGTLQECMDKNIDFNWQAVITQLVQGCRYLAENLIVHRDIKPANVFRKGNQWKIGDFGFARYIENKQTEVKQVYKVGSPLFMPPETFMHGIYSLKTDSFALGVLFFYMITKKYPWPGQTSNQLKQFYKLCKFPSQMLSHLPYNLQNLITNLCNPNISERPLVANVNLNINQARTYMIKKISQPKLSGSANLRRDHHRNIQNPENNEGKHQLMQSPEVRELLQRQGSKIQQLYKDGMQLDSVHRLKLLKFLFYLTSNMEEVVELGYLCQMVERLLRTVVITLFNWQSQNPNRQPSPQQPPNPYRKYIDQFTKPTFPKLSYISQLTQVQQSTHNEITNMSNFTSDKRIQILRMKLIQFHQILKLILSRNPNKLRQFLSKTILHPDFAKVYVTAGQVQDAERVFRKWSAVGEQAGGYRVRVHSVGGEVGLGLGLEGCSDVNSRSNSRINSPRDMEQKPSTLLNLNLNLNIDTNLNPSPLPSPRTHLHPMTQQIPTNPQTSDNNNQQPNMQLVQEVQQKIQQNNEIKDFNTQTQQNKPNVQINDQNNCQFIGKETVNQGDCQNQIQIEGLDSVMN